MRLLERGQQRGVRALVVRQLMQLVQIAIVDRIGVRELQRQHIRIRHAQHQMTHGLRLGDLVGKPGSPKRA